MADISLEAVTGKLNRVGYEAFIQALRQAKGAGNRNLELAHWLGHLLVGALKKNELRRALNGLSREFGKINVDTLAGEHRGIWRNSEEENLRPMDGSGLRAAGTPGAEDAAGPRGTT